MKQVPAILLARAPAAALAAIGVVWGGFAALVPVIKSQAGLGDGAFGVVMLIAAIGAVTAMWLAPRADAVLVRWSLPVLTVAMAGAFVLPGFSVAGASLAVSMLLASMTSGTLDVAANARIAQLEGSAQRPLMNLCHGVFSAAYAISALATGGMRELGLSASEILIILAVVTCLLVALMGETPTPIPEDEPVTSPRATPNGLPWALILPGGLIVLVAFLAEQAVEGWSALHLERGLGAGPAQGAFGPALLGFTMAIGRFTGQALSQRVGEAVLLSWGAVLAALGAAIAAWAMSLSLAYLGFICFGLGISVIAPTALAWVAGKIAPRQKANAIARLTVIGYSGFFIGPPIMGGLAELSGLEASFTFIALLLFAIPGLLIPMLRRTTRAPQSA